MDQKEIDAITAHVTALHIVTAFLLAKESVASNTELSDMHSAFTEKCSELHQSLPSPELSSQLTAAFDSVYSLASVFSTKLKNCGTGGSPDSANPPQTPS